MLQKPLWSTLAYAAFFTGPLWAADPILTIDAGKPGVEVSPTLYGLMTEEINHSYDGGLYAELIQNRSFKDSDTNPVHWSLLSPAGAGTSMALSKDQPINTALTTCLEVKSTDASDKQPAGIVNDGYWGIPFKNVSYHFSFYAKSQGAFAGPLTVSIQEKGRILIQTEIMGITQEWKRYEGILAPVPSGIQAQTNDARFVISWTTPGTLDFNLVSLFPPTVNERPNGMRPDIMEKLAAMSPKFLRLPGGNFLEGDHIQTRFEWKKTIGPISERPGHAGCWSYRASDGMGLLEYLEWCEDLHIQPVLAVYGGYSMKQEHVVGDDLKPYIQDDLDEIEYVTGDASTTWGARRIADGHPAPFPLNFVEVGNEDFFDKSKSYNDRFAQIFDAIRAKYPKLKIIATTPVQSRVPDLVDDHFYRSAFQMEKDDHHYDNAPRNGPKIFVGEWATREGSPTPYFNAAQGDAAWMTMMERNSDLVLIASYAPLFVNVNDNPKAWQWGTDLIGYNNMTSYGSPSYYAQVMFAGNVGDHVLNTSIDNMPMADITPPPPKPKPGVTPTPPKPESLAQLHFVTTVDTTNHMIILKLVNTQPTAQPVQINLTGVKSLGSKGSTITLSAKDPKDTNTIDQPTNIVPVNSDLSLSDKPNFTYAFPAYSITVMKLPYTP